MGMRRCWSPGLPPWVGAPPRLNRRPNRFRRVGSLSSLPPCCEAVALPPTAASSGSFSPPPSGLAAKPLAARRRERGIVTQMEAGQAVRMQSAASSSCSVKPRPCSRSSRISLATRCHSRSLVRNDSAACALTASMFAFAAPSRRTVLGAWASASASWSATTPSSPAKSVCRSKSPSIMAATSASHLNLRRGTPRTRAASSWLQASRLKATLTVGSQEPSLFWDRKRRHRRARSIQSTFAFRLPALIMTANLSYSSWKPHWLPVGTWRSMCADAWNRLLSSSGVSSAELRMKANTRAVPTASPSLTTGFLGPDSGSSYSTGPGAAPGAAPCSRCTELPPTLWPLPSSSVSPPRVRLPQVAMDLRPWAMRCRAAASVAWSSLMRCTDSPYLRPTAWASFPGISSSGRAVRRRAKGMPKTAQRCTAVPSGASTSLSISLCSRCHSHSPLAPSRKPHSGRMRRARSFFFSSRSRPWPMKAPMFMPPHRTMTMANRSLILVMMSPGLMPARLLREAVLVFGFLALAKSVKWRHMHCVGPLNTQPGPWNAWVVAFQKHCAPLAGLLSPQLGPVKSRRALVPVMGLGSAMSAHCTEVPPTAV